MSYPTGVLAKIIGQKLKKNFMGLCVVAPTLVAAVPAGAQLSVEPQDADQHVIVIMKSQHEAAPKGSNARAVRASVIAAEQAPLMDELQQVHAANIKSYKLVNALAATVSKGEVERLKANPAVAKVIPDFIIQRPKRPAMDTLRSSQSAESVKQNGGTLTPNVIPGACGAKGAVLLQPEGLALTNTDSDIANAPTARSLGIDGTGVKVAWIADGVDPDNINFIRPDHKSVFDPSIGGDYKDFSGDGPNALTGGDEAFLDSNTIAGQGIHVYDVSHYTFQPDPSACKIRIEGVAPGAAEVGLRAFGTFEISTLSIFLEAIDYAVEVDAVDVLNESYGSNDFPDVTAVDVQKLFDEAAVAAGVVVTVCSFDAGASNTITSPATDPLLIGVGASTQFQFYAQTNLDAARYFATTGWLSNNISNLSSGGFDEAGGTISLVAPGDLSWASCEASRDFADCTDYAGKFIDFESAGGTSESSPWTAGTAALVIQAYRLTHGGASPTPALVKQILLSTATDLEAPAVEQGAGLVNAYRAVLLAESIATADGTPTPIGDTLVLSTNQLNAVGKPNTPNHWRVTITNTGAFTQVVDLSGRTLGPAQKVRTGSVTLNDATSPKLISWGGVPENWATFSFSVPAGIDRLNASMAYPQKNPNGDDVHLVLIDPEGRYAASSLPQGIANFANVDVVSPIPGVWTGAIFGAVKSVGGVNATIPWQVETETYVPFGSATPNSVKLAPGQSQSFAFSANTPLSPGDLDGSIVLTSGLGFNQTTTIPVTLRSQVVVGSGGGSFSGVLTGGNGRPPNEGQVQYYQFNVPKGVTNIAANLSLTNEATLGGVGLYLVSPDGDTLGYAENSGLYATAYTLNPAPGLWTLIVEFAGPDIGNEVAQPYSGNIIFNHITATTTGLPEGPSHHLAAGTPVNYTVSVTNNGVSPQLFFIDPRLEGVTDLVLPTELGTSGTVALPVTSEPYWLVPTETSSISLLQTSSLPAMFDFSPFPGDPLLASANFGPGPLCSTTAAASYSPPGNSVTAGFWAAEPTECGPYPARAPSGSATISMTATGKPFDAAVTSTTGDFWLFSIDPTYALFNPLFLNPGDKGTITVTFTPSGTSGTVVSGALYLGALVPSVSPYGIESADELAAFPYVYSIK